MKPKPLSDQEQIRRGELIVELFSLKAIRSQAHDLGMTNRLYDTKHGTKTALGLFRSIKRLIETGE